MFCTHSGDSESQVTKNKASKKILVDEVDQRLGLAEEATVDEFFTQWMTKPPRKAQVGTWFVLHQDETFVYWGRPLTGGFLFQSKRFVERLYKTRRSHLQEHFPSYESVWGNTVRLALRRVITEHRQSSATQERVKLGINDFAATLHKTAHGNQIKAAVKANIFSDKTGRQVVEYEITLDIDNLERIGIIET